ncbi:hypothetical protein JCM10908_000725 [Rhodotorula pacifica]|uniref:uncharacterized protein n=1 Tax=Rhodotorula pacifica TaxID=1495444 RepID=UPI00317E20D7
MASNRPDALQVLTKAFQCQGDPTEEELSCLPEIQRHLYVYPFDDEFVIERTPGTDYGSLICMEESCFEEIKLEPSPLVADGGLGRGVGWLQKYGEHVTQKPGHVQCRNKRLQLDKAIKSEAPPDSWTPKLEKPSSSLNSAHSSDAESKKLQGAVERKPEYQPVASGSGSRTSSGSGASSSSAQIGKAPKKRPSDPMHRSSAGAVFADDLEPLDKKPKLAPEPGVLAPAHANALSAPQSQAALHPAAVARSKVDAARAQLSAHVEVYRALSEVPATERDADWTAQTSAAMVKYQQLLAQLTAAEQVYAVQRHQEAQRLLAANMAANAGPLAGDAMMGVMNSLSGMGMPGQFGGGADDSDDEEARLWSAVDRGMNEDELEQFVKGVCDSEGFEGNANVNNAAAVIGLKNQQAYLPHMNIRLMPHQIIACAWMKEQEAGKQYGGILADEMGLGKTVEAIATCILNPSNDPEEKTTLVLAPLALLQQWKNELEEKVEKDYVSVLIYHGPDRRQYKVKHLKKYDFILTTYATLIADYGDEESLEKKAKAKAKRVQKDTGEAQDWEDFLERGEDGPLFKMSFYRVIIDEAQYIRNRQTKISRAVTRIDSLYRWALTGTPVTNSLADLFPIFRFLQLKPWYEWTRYREHVIAYEKKRPDVAGRKAQAILRSCMLRRKKDSKLDGKELISLPPKTITMHELEFSPEEREIYEMVETRAQQKFNKFLKAGTVMRNYSHVLVLLLRLRQLCIHPALLIDAEETLAKKEEMKEAIKQDAKRAKMELGPEFVQLIKKRLLDAAVERIEAEHRGTEVAEDECAICVESYEQNENGAAVTRCGHIFCMGCIEDYLKGAAPQDHDEEGPEAQCKENQRPCPMCRKPFSREEVYNLQSFQPTDEEICTAANLDAGIGNDDDDSESLNGFIVDDDADDDDDDYGKKSQQKKKAPRMSNRAVVNDSEDEQSEAEEESAPPRKKDKERESIKGKGKAKADDKGKGKEAAKTFTWGDQEPSTKILWAYNELDRMFAENPTDKVIIISSFTSALDLMNEFLLRKGVKSCRYQGDMNIGEREEAIRKLKKSNKTRVMLLSLKCGGVGLTLTRANRVIALDLAWSTAVESQAFDRVHRIGQEKEVVVNRLTIKETVEQRILALQERKQGLADAATGEGTGQKMGKLTVDDLAGLFGLNRRGERLRPRIATPEQH